MKNIGSNRRELEALHSAPDSLPATFDRSTVSAESEPPVIPSSAGVAPSADSHPDPDMTESSTLEMGDILIPRSYQQALQSVESSYWRDAITSKELNGLLEIGTFEFVRVHVIFRSDRM